MFRNQLERILTGFPEGEELILAGDLNGHVGMDREGIERGRGERVLEMAQTYDLALLNTFFERKEEHLITIMSGGNIRGNYLGKVRNGKVVAGEFIAAKHRLLIADPAGKILLIP